MKSALECLNLTPNPSKEIKKELNLIEGVKRLSQLGSRVLPVQVRLKKNKLDLIQELLNSYPYHYSQVNEVCIINLLILFFLNFSW